MDFAEAQQQLAERQPTVIVDWDGTCVPSAWPEKPREWMPGSREALRALLDGGYRVVVHSARTHQRGIDYTTDNEDRMASFLYIRGMLDDAGLYDVVVNMREDENKPGAFAYIDDRGVRFDGENWPQIVDDLLEFAPNPPRPTPLEKFIENAESGEEAAMLSFHSGATRNRKENELAFEGFVSPLALKMYAEYMHEHRFTADGSVRDPDNWQKGIPLDSYIDSLIRHVIDLWLIHRGFGSAAREDLKSALAGIFFNVQGYMHETAKTDLRPSREELLEEELEAARARLERIELEEAA